MVMVLGGLGMTRVLVQVLLLTTIAVCASSSAGLTVIASRYTVGERRDVAQSSNLSDTREGCLRLKKP